MSITAMKQAHEAMNAMLTHMGMDEDEWNKVTFDQMREAITSLRQAIAEAEQEPVAWVELTVEEIEECKFQSVNGTGWSTDIDIDQMAKNIEAKLKQKNGH